MSKDENFFGEDPFEGLDDLDSEFEDFDEYESWVEENKIDQRQPDPNQGPQVLAVNRYNEVESIDLDSYVSGSNEFYFQDDPPENPTSGAIWVRTTDVVKFYYIDDGTGLKWVQIPNLPKEFDEYIKILVEGYAPQPASGGGSVDLDDIQQQLNNKLDDDFAVFKDVGTRTPPSPGLDAENNTIPQTTVYTRSFLQGSVRITQHIAKDHTGDEILVYETREVL